MPESGYSTNAGYVNNNKQRIIGRTDWDGNGYYQKIYVMECEICGFRYDVNGSDTFQRKRPKCQGGASCSNPLCCEETSGKGNC